MIDILLLSLQKNLEDMEEFKQLKRFPSVMYDVPIADIKQQVLELNTEDLLELFGKPIGTRTRNYYFRYNQEYAILTYFRGNEWILDYTGENIKEEIFKRLNYGI